MDVHEDDFRIGILHRVRVGEDGQDDHGGKVQRGGTPDCENYYSLTLGSNYALVTQKACLD